MSDKSEEPESEAGGQKPPKIKAEDNPWYLLATLWGVPTEQDDERIGWNRRSWNRYYAKHLDAKTREFLVTERGYSADELVPLSQEDEQTVKRQFNVRASRPNGYYDPANPNGSVVRQQRFIIPDSSADIDFSNVEFAKNVYFGKYIFCSSFFGEAIFRAVADFEGAAFFGWIHFVGVTFSERATFEDAVFPPSRWKWRCQLRVGNFCQNCHFQRCFFLYVRFFQLCYFLRQRVIF
jgi:hypothetical protein